MATETLSIPEDHLLEVIAIIRLGLQSTPKVTPEVRRQLRKWCNDEETYMRRLMGSSQKG